MASSAHGAAVRILPGRPCYAARMAIAPVRRVVCAAVVAAGVLLSRGPARAVDLHLDAEAIDQAITFARQAERPARVAFHDGYLRVPGTELRRVSVVTEYRRVVLLTEEKMRVLDRNYGVRQMTEALKPWRGLIEIIAELQFHPQNTYVSVPAIDVLLVPLDVPGTPMPIVADATDRRPRFGMFWEPTPADAPWWPFPPPSTPVLGGTEPLTGGWVHARFDAAGLRRGRYEVAVRNGTATLGRVQFDFSALR